MLRRFPLLLLLASVLSGCVGPDDPTPTVDEVIETPSPRPWNITVDEFGSPPGFNACAAGICLTGDGDGIIVHEVLQERQRLESVHLDLTDAQDSMFPNDFRFTAIYQETPRSDAVVIGEATSLPAFIDLDDLDLPPGGLFRVEVINQDPTSEVLVSGLQAVRAVGTLSGHDTPVA